MSEDAKSIIGWFGKRKEGVLQKGMHEHAIAVFDCVTELGNAMAAMASGDKATASKAVQRLYVLEHEADGLEQMLCNQLSIGELDPQDREDFLHFVKKTDGIANWCKQAGIHLKLMVDTGVVVPVQVLEAFTSTVSDLRAEVDALINAINAMTSGSDDLMESVRDIKEEERRVDQAYESIMKAVLTSDMDHRATTLALRMLDSIEEAADTCKGCAETITILYNAKRV